MNNEKKKPLRWANVEVLTCLPQNLLIYVFQNHSVMHLFIRQATTKCTSKWKPKHIPLTQQTHCLEVTPSLYSQKYDKIWLSVCSLNIVWNTKKKL